jgi:hypothetical protein
VENCWIEFQCTETSGINPVSLTTVPYFFSKMEVSLNGNTTAIQTLYPDDLYMQLSYIPVEELRHISDELNISTATFDPLADLAAGATMVYRLPLHSALFRSFNLDTLSPGADVLVTLDLAYPQLGGAGVLNLDTIFMKFSTFYHPLVSEKAVSRAIMYPTIHPFLDVSTSSHSQQLNASSTVDILLSGINSHEIFQMLVSIRASKALADILTFEDPDAITFDLLSPSKTTLLGSHRTGQSLSWENFQTAPYSNRLFQNRGIVPIVLGSDPGTSIATRSSSGGLESNGSHYLRLSLPSTWTSGQYFIDVAGYSLAAVKEEKGAFQRLY